MTSKEIILCVDDDRIILDSLKTQLKNNLSKSCIIEIAESGEEALEIIEECLVTYGKTPQIVISDFLMPTMKGDDFLEIVHSKYPDIIKILLTGQAQKKDIVNVINKSSLYRFIAKPWDTTDFNLTIEQALAYYNKSKELESQRDQLLSLNKNLTNLIEINTKELIEKSAQIQASYKSASYIQNSIFPELKYLQNLLPQSFIFHKSLHKVSGDCYFFAELEDKIILSAIDCTGHGIPGALLSVIAILELNKIIYDENITSPSKILSKLHDKVVQILKQENTGLSDGMDMSMVCIDKLQRSLTFSGAKRPIIWVSKGELNYVKGDSLPIGGLINHERNYKEIVINIEDDTVLYLFSDGYTDQFGGDEDQKFMMKNFRDLLLNISEKGMNQQYNIIKNCLNNWQSSFPQTDDILVIGVKICPQK